MRLHSLKPAQGSTKQRKRVGRGQGSGRGGTSTRGHKGAGSRSGYSKKRGFEGGQMPLQRRIPKRGFKNINRVEYNVFNLDRLQSISEKYQTTEIGVDFLIQNGYASKNDNIKVLARGEFNVKLNLTAHKASASAIAAVQAAGGSINLI